MSSKVRMNLLLTYVICLAVLPVSIKHRSCLLPQKVIITTTQFLEIYTFRDFHFLQPLRTLSGVTSSHAWRIYLQSRHTAGFWIFQMVWGHDHQKEAILAPSAVLVSYQHVSMVRPHFTVRWPHILHCFQQKKTFSYNWVKTVYLY